jgi:hypothetical protein
MLQHDAIPDLQALHIVAHLDNLAYYLVPWVGEMFGGYCCWRDAEIAITIDQVQIAAAYSGQAITYTHPVGRR